VIGAILRYAIHWSPAHVNVQLIGLILMIGGAIGLIISLVFLMRRRDVRPVGRGLRAAGPPSLRAGTLSLRIVTPSLRAVSRARWLFEADVAQAYTGDEALVAGRHHSGHLVIEGRVGAAVAGQAEVDRSQLIDPQAAEVAFCGLLL